MKQLTHKSFDTFLRKMQMSRTKLFVFVEGKRNDPFFYGNICGKIFSNSNISYKIYTSKDIPGQSVEKLALCNFFKYLEQRSELLNEFKGMKTAAIFFLDKDIDDLLDTQIISDHVVYSYYSSFAPLNWRRGAYSRCQHVKIGGTFLLNFE